MAFTLHWSNHAYGCSENTKLGDKRSRPEKSVEPALSLQKDVILPRVVGHFGGGADDVEIEDQLYGCRGHGLDQEFPLKPTSDVCMPLVFCRGDDKDAKDVCAEPVLNWEKYVLNLKSYTEPKGLKCVRFDVEELLRGRSGVPMQPSQPQTAPQRKSLKGVKRDGSEREIEIPDCRVEGTWNFNYTNQGACDVLKDEHGMHKVLVGNGEALRVVTLEDSPESSPCRFKVIDVMDERRSKRQGAIRQIQCMKSESLAVVRRRSRISIYALDTEPAELDRIHRGYGLRLKDMGFLTFDCNPYNCNEVVTIDSNHEVRLHNFVKGTSEFLFKMKSDELGSIWPDGPSEFSINASSSIRYLNHPSLMLVQHGGSLCLYDKRAKLLEDLKVENPRNLFDIKEDTVLFSDYFRGCYDGSTLRPEYISSVAPSTNQNYYHIGTSLRIFTMDWRVPGNPVLRCSHGLNGPLTYLQSSVFDDHEIVIGGSQRTNETFAAVLDHGHRVCRERSGCEALNPILASYPRHLLSTNESFDDQTNSLPWSDQRKLMEKRYEAWCSGLATIGISRNAFAAGASLSVFTTNSFGDVFYQEWKHKEEQEATIDSVQAIHSPVMQEALDNLVLVSKRHAESLTRENSEGAFDLSLVVDEVSASVSKVLDIRSTSFRAFVRTKDVENVRSMNRVRSDMSCCKGPLVEKLCQAWEENTEEMPEDFSASEEDSSHANATVFEESSRTLTSEGLEIPVDVEIKEEPEDYDDSDIEVLQHEPKITAPAEELVLSDSEFYGIPGLGAFSLTNGVLSDTGARDEEKDENTFSHAEPVPSMRPINQRNMETISNQADVERRRVLGPQSFSSQPVKRRAGFK